MRPEHLQALESWLYRNSDTGKCLLDMKHSWSKNAFWDENNMIWRKCFSLFHFSHLITLMAYLCSQWTPKARIKYFMFVWSIYRIFVLNWERKRVSLQIMVFVYFSSAWGIVEINTRYEMWTTRNDENGVSLFNLSYLITLRVYLFSQRTPNVKINYFMFDWSMYRLFVLNRAWKRVSHQIMIFVHVCPTWDIVELNTRFETWITRIDVNGVSLFHFSNLLTLMS
jgi:hypothetical protein